MINVAVGKGGTDRSPAGGAAAGQPLYVQANRLMFELEFIGPAATSSVTGAPPPPLVPRPLSVTAVKVFVRMAPVAVCTIPPAVLPAVPLAEVTRTVLPVPVLICAFSRIAPVSSAVSTAGLIKPAMMIPGPVPAIISMLPLAELTAPFTVIVSAACSAIKPPLDVMPPAPTVMLPPNGFPASFAVSTIWPLLLETTAVPVSIEPSTFHNLISLPGAVFLRLPISLVSPVFVTITSLLVLLMIFIALPEPAPNPHTTFVFNGFAILPIPAPALSTRV